MSVEFCDTNVLVYAYDRSDPEKRRRALDVVERLWAEGTGVVSVQVLQELYVTLARRVDHDDARAVVVDLADAWPVVEPVRGDVLAAMDDAHRWQISFWDAMVLGAARKAGAQTMWSEDLQHGREYDRVLVLNPLRDPA
jgi:predicted nucleic acid-binding protein